MHRQFQRQPLHLFRLPVIAPFFVALLLLASCGDSDSDSDDGTTAEDAAGDTSADGGVGDADETTDADDPDDADASTDDASTDDTAPPAGELTDSFRGVTADSIRLGIVITDVEIVGRDNGDVEGQWQAAIDEVNADGGILGRNLEPVFAKYSPLGDVESEAACVKLTQDEMVFAAMGPLLSNLTCFTDTNDTIFISSYGFSQEELDRSKAVVIGPGALPGRSAGIAVNALKEADQLEGPVAIHAAADSSDERDIYKAALEDAGVEVATETQSTVAGDDVAAVEAEMQAFAQVWESSDAEIVLAIGTGSGLNVVAGVDSGTYRPKLIVTNGSDLDPNLYRDLGYSLDALEGSVATGFRDFQDLATSGDAGVGDCIARYEDASGDTINIDPADGEVVNLNTTVWACQGIDIFSQVAEAAGTDLTNESFREAAESLGDLSVTAVEEASIGEGKYDIGDGDPLLLTFDADADDFVPLG